MAVEKFVYDFFLIDCVKYCDVHRCNDIIYALLYVNIILTKIVKTIKADDVNCVTLF